MGIFNTQDAAYAAIYAEEAAMVDASSAIAEALDATGMSRTQLADLLGVSKSEITARLRGERNITVRQLARTLHALGASLEIAANVSRLSVKPSPKVVQLHRHNVTRAHDVAPASLKQVKAALAAVR